MGALYLCPKYMKKHLIANVACCIQINMFCVIDRATYWAHFVPRVSSAEPPAAAPVVPVGGSGENFQTLKDARQPSPSWLSEQRREKKLFYHHAYFFLNIFF